MNEFQLLIVDSAECTLSRLIDQLEFDNYRLAPTTLTDLSDLKPTLQRPWDLILVESTSIRWDDSYLNTLLRHPEPVLLMSGQQRRSTAVRLIDAAMQAPHPSDERLRRQRAEEALRISEHRYRDLVENSNDVIFSVDFEGTVTYISPVVRKMTGYDPEEVIGKNFADFILPRDLPILHQSFKETMQGHIQPAEYRIITKEGDLRWVRSSALPIVETGSSPIVQGRITDITENKHLEAQLRQSQKMEAIGQLAGGIAHDFNNLLMVIRGYAELSLEECDSLDPMRQHITEIQAAAERASSLTHQLLAFSRKQIMLPRVVDLNEIVLGARRMLERLIGEDIALVVDTTPEPLRIKADHHQIEQVIMNLSVNARDAMPDGGVLNIRTTSAESNSQGSATTSMVRLIIRDNGHGMDEATLSRIFEPFFTTKPEGKGTGLGLATVYGIIRQSSGTISVESRLDYGTKFEISFPRISQAPEEKVDPELKLQANGSERVLVVEDQAGVRRLTVRFLENLGYRVLHAGDVDEAQRLARGEKIDLLITDMVMPVMSGKALANVLAQAHPGLKVLFISGYIDQSRLGSLPHLKVAFLQKPFSQADLTGMVRQLLDS